MRGFCSLGYGMAPERLARSERCLRSYPTSSRHGLDIRFKSVVACLFSCFGLGVVGYGLFHANLLLQGDRRMWVSFYRQTTLAALESGRRPCRIGPEYIMITIPGR